MTGVNWEYRVRVSKCDQHYAEARKVITDAEYRDPTARDNAEQQAAQQLLGLEGVAPDRLEPVGWERIE